MNRHAESGPRGVGDPWRPEDSLSLVNVPLRLVVDVVSRCDETMNVVLQTAEAVAASTGSRLGPRLG